MRRAPAGRTGQGLDEDASTRMLVHAALLLQQGSGMAAACRMAVAVGGRGSARWLLLISDGQPHNVDVQDPRYLVDDARQAVRDAAARLTYSRPQREGSRRPDRS